MLEREWNLQNRNINLFNHRGQTTHIEANGAAGFLFVNMAPFHCCLVAKLCLTFRDPMDCSKPGFPVPDRLPGSPKFNIHCVGDAIQPSHPLSYMAPFYGKQKCNAYFFFLVIPEALNIAQTLFAWKQGFLSVFISAASPAGGTPLKHSGNIWMTDWMKKYTHA